GCLQLPDARAAHGPVRCTVHGLGRHRGAHHRLPRGTAHRCGHRLPRRTALPPDPAHHSPPQHLIVSVPGTPSSVARTHHTLWKTGHAMDSTLLAVVAIVVLLLVVGGFFLVKPQRPVPPSKEETNPEVTGEPPAAPPQEDRERDEGTVRTPPAKA